MRAAHPAAGQRGRARRGRAHDGRGETQACTSASPPDQERYAAYTPLTLHSPAPPHASGSMRPAPTRRRAHLMREAPGSWAAATYLGLTHEELRAELREGKSLAQIARSGQERGRARHRDARSGQSAAREGRRGQANHAATGGRDPRPPHRPPRARRTAGVRGRRTAQSSGSTWGKASRTTVPLRARATPWRSPRARRRRA